VQFFRTRSCVASFLMTIALSVAVAGCATQSTHPD